VNTKYWLSYVRAVSCYASTVTVDSL